MPTPNIYTSLAGGGPAAGQIEATEAGIQKGTALANIDLGVGHMRLGNRLGREMPQLQSNIAAAGQFYSSARKRDEGYLNEDFYNAGYDLNSAFQRQMGDFDQQRIFAALGAIV